MKYLKFVGLLNLTLHELILCEKIEVIEKRIKCLSSGRKSQPELLNQYDDNGKKHVMIIMSFFSVFFISSVSFFLFLILNLSIFLSFSICVYMNILTIFSFFVFFQVILHCLFPWKWGEEILSLRSLVPVPHLISTMSVLAGNVHAYVWEMWNYEIFLTYRKMKFSLQEYAYQHCKWYNLIESLPLQDH